MQKNRKLRQTVLALSVSSALALPALAYSQSWTYPPVELRLAREELDSARLALDAREYERARRLAEQADQARGERNQEQREKDGDG